VTQVKKEWKANFHQEHRISSPVTGSAVQQKHQPLLAHTQKPNKARKDVAGL